MFNLTNLKTTTYSVDDTAYLLDVVESEQDIEAYIYKINYGIKMLTIGLAKPHTEEELLDLIDNCIDIYISDYKEEYE